MPKIKGTHTAMKSGMTAAVGRVHALRQGGAAEVTSYRASAAELGVGRTAQGPQPAAGLPLGPVGRPRQCRNRHLYARGRAPWTFHHHADSASLKKASASKPIDYPRPDGKISFDRLSSVYLSNTNHEENQPCHLTLKDATIPIAVNLKEFDAPEQRYCPAGVYEIVRDPAGAPRLQINAQNCVHCKTCDIKDPTQNINWVVPEGGGGPNYPNM